VDAFPTDTFAGSIKEIRLRSSISANVVTYTTIIDAPNSNMKLKPGMTANITIYTREINHVLIVPAAALTFLPDSLLMEKYQLTNVAKSPNKKSKASRTNKPPLMADSNGVPVINGSVWIRKDSSTIISRHVTTGLDDKTIVQIITGLVEGDEVITGYSKLDKNAAAAKTTKSPFMPTRGGGGGRPH
jgi:HlyD family secretion protein